MDKPVIKIQLTQADKIVEVAGYLLLAALWGMVICFYNNSSGVVPLHFNLAGEADGFGDRRTLFITPVLCTFIFFVLTEVIKYPEMFNYPVTITPENAKRQYTVATRMMRALKIIVTLIFAVVEYHTYFTAANNNSAIGKWLFPVTSALLLIPLIYYVSKAGKAS